MGNVRSLANKTDELAGLVRTQRVYRESSVLCFTETWLHEDIPDANVTVVWTAFRLLGRTGITERVARGKVADLLFLLTTSGVILVMSR